jgi:purine-binding chemotaxis protein CheW
MPTSTTRSELFAGLDAAEIDLLERRAARYGRRADDDAGETVEVVAFRRGSTKYATVLRSLREIRPLRRFTRIPGASPAVPGIFHYRGQILSVHDVSAFLSGAPQPFRPAWVLIAEHGPGSVGLVADEIIGVEPVASRAVRPVPVALGDKGAGFTGVAHGDLLLLNIPALLSIPAFFNAF